MRFSCSSMSVCRSAGETEEEREKKRGTALRKGSKKGRDKLKKPEMTLLNARMGRNGNGDAPFSSPFPLCPTLMATTWRIFFVDRMVAGGGHLLLPVYSGMGSIRFTHPACFRSSSPHPFKRLVPWHVFLPIMSSFPLSLFFAILPHFYSSENVRRCGLGRGKKRKVAWELK